VGSLYEFENFCAGDHWNVRPNISVRQWPPGAISEPLRVNRVLITK